MIIKMSENKKEYEHDILFEIIKEFIGEGCGPVDFKEDELEEIILELYGKEFDSVEYFFAIEKALEKGIINKSITYYTNK